MTYAVLIAAALLAAPQLPAKARTPALIAQVQRQPKMALDLVVTGPKESQPGDLVVLDSSNSQGVSAGTWTISPLEAAGRMLVVENGSKVVFATATPARYVFYFSGCTSDGKTVRIVAHEVQVGGVVPPNPNPVPPTPPGPGPAPPIPPPGPTPLGLTQFVIDEAAKVTDPQKAAVAALAVKACDNVLKRIADGTLTNQAAIHADFQAQLSSVGFFSYMRYWRPFLNALALKFDSLGFDQETTTKEQLLQAYAELGAGLRQVR